MCQILIDSSIQNLPISTLFLFFLPLTNFLIFVFIFLILQTNFQINTIAIKFMVLPTDTTLILAQRYQGVVIVQVACTLVIYTILRIIHFCKWGHVNFTKSEEAPQNKQSEPAEENERKWDQESWDVYFPIIFANHLISLALPILYTPSVFTCVVSFIHFALFFALIIINIFTKDEDEKTTKTSVSRIIWGLMCLVNIVLIITGLAGIRVVITNATPTV